MKRLESYCKVRKGILSIAHQEDFKENLKLLSDGNYKIVIEKIYNKRSNPQNAYLWGVVYPIVKDGLIDAGFDEFKQDNELEMTHELCKFRFLKKQITSSKETISGSITVYKYLDAIGSTCKLTTVQFMEYLANIHQWASEYLQVFIPDPDPNYAEAHENIF